MNDLGKLSDLLGNTSNFTISGDGYLTEHTSTYGGKLENDMAQAV